MLNDDNAVVTPGTSMRMQISSWFPRAIARDLWCDVREEVPIGKVPLRLDVVLIRRGEYELSAEAARKLATLVQRLNRFTLVEFKAPSDALEQGDFDYLLGCAHLFRAHEFQIPTSR